MTQSYFWLSDEQFERLVPLLPRDTRGKPRVDDRRMISGIGHVLKSGCRWQTSTDRGRRSTTVFRPVGGERYLDRHLHGAGGCRRVIVRRYDRQFRRPRAPLCQRSIA
jgi:transposase